MTPLEMKVYMRLRGKGLTHEGSSALAAALTSLALQRQPVTVSEMDSLAAQTRPRLTAGDSHLLTANLRFPSRTARNLSDEIAKDLKAEREYLRTKFREWDEKQTQLMALLVSVIKAVGQLRTRSLGSGL
jgi:hypothetical protein